MTGIFAALFILFMQSAPAEPDAVPEILNNERVMEIGRQLRCVVCENQSVSDSDSLVAMNMRDLIRERIEKGESDAEILDYMVSRYGDYVLLKPRFSGVNLVLWLSPFALLAVILPLLWQLRRRGEPVDEAPTALSEAERAELSRLRAMADESDPYVH